MRINLYILLLLFIYGCKRSNYENSATFYFRDNIVLNDYIGFYSYKNGYYIGIKKNESYIYNSIVDSIVFSLNGKRYNAYPVKLYFSRERPNSCFEYPINNKTRKIETVILQNKVMFGIEELKENIIDELVKSGAIKLHKIDKDYSP